MSALSTRKITPEQTLHHCSDNEKVLFTFHVIWVRDAINNKLISATQLVRLNKPKIKIRHHSVHLRNAVITDADSMKLFMNLDKKHENQLTIPAKQRGLDRIFESGNLSPSSFLKLPYFRAEYFLMEPVQKAF